MKRGGPSMALVMLMAAGCATVPEGRSVVDSVHVKGASRVDADDIEERLATAPSPKFLGLFRGVIYDYTVFNQRTLDVDLERVERFYRARGYYDARARSGLATTTSEGHVAIRIEVDEGVPVLVAAVTLEGLDALSPALRKRVTALASLTLPVGDPFDEARYEAAERGARRVLSDRGYAFVKVTRRAEVDLVTHTASLAYSVEPGPRAVYGEITFEGLGGLPELPVRRAFMLAAGDRFSTADLDAARVSLLDLGVFSNVEIHTDLSAPTGDPATVPVRVVLEPSQVRAWLLGAGVEIDLIRTDVHATVGWEHGNFLGGLRKLTIEVRPGLVLFPTRLPKMAAPTHYLPEERARIQLSQPGFIESRTRGFVRADFDVYAVLLSPNIDPLASVLGYRELRAAVGVDRTLWKLFGQTSLNLQRNDPFTYVGPLDPSLTGATLSYIDIFLQLDLRDDKVSPHKGLLVAGDVQLAAGRPFGDARDIRVQPEARVYLPTSRRTTFGLRGSVGLLFPFDYGDTLVDNAAGKAQPPGVERAAWVKDVQLVYFRAFFSGGPNSNRGYAVRGVGPHGVVPFFHPALAARELADSCAPGSPSYNQGRCVQPLGGMSLWELSAEFRFPATGPLSSAVFCDTSDVSPRRLDLRFDRPHLSCGSGLRYATPVGPIRIDVGYRVPGMQVLSSYDHAEEGDPGTIFGAPVAISLGIGEAF